MIWVAGILIYIWIARFLIPSFHNYLLLGVILFLIFYSLRVGFKITLIILIILLLCGAGAFITPIFLF